MKITVTNNDGSTTDFFPQSYTDQAVAAAVAAQMPVNTVTPDVSEVPPCPHGRLDQEICRGVVQEPEGSPLVSFHRQTGNGGSIPRSWVKIPPRILVW